MAFEVILPKLDEAMTSGKIIKWHKQAGDTVAVGDVIVEIETEKVNCEIESEAAGTLSELLAEEGDDVELGKPLVYVLDRGEEIPEGADVARVISPEKAVGMAESAPLGASEEAAHEASVSTAGIKASPLAKRIARANGLDLSRVTGTGLGGRIVRADVEEALRDRSLTDGTSAAVGGATPLEEEAVPLSSTRTIIARRMTESFQAPHFYVSVDADAGKLKEVRASLVPLVEERTGLRLTLSDLLVKMAAQALVDHPKVNSAYVDGGSVKVFGHVDIGLVAAVEDGLVVPVIRRADTKSLSEITRSRDDLVRRARERRLSMDEMRGSTFTISNMGMYEVDQFSAILQPPEAAILAVGRIEERAVVRHGDIVARPVMTLTLSIDHRVLDAALGAAFLGSVKGYIENPVNLLA